MKMFGKIKQFFRTETDCIQFEPQNLLRYRNNMFGVNYDTFCVKIRSFDYCSELSDGCEICPNVNQCQSYFDMRLCGLKGGKPRR